MALTDSASMRAWAGSYTPHGRSQWAWTVTGRNRRDSRICTTPLHNEVIGSETCGHADRQGTLLLLDITPQHLPHRTQVKPGYSRPRSCQVSPLSVASVACPKSLCVCLVPLVPGHVLARPRSAATRTRCGLAMHPAVLRHPSKDLGHATLASPTIKLPSREVLCALGDGDRSRPVHAS